MTEKRQEPSLGVHFGMVQMGIFSQGSFISDLTPHAPQPKPTSVIKQVGSTL